MGRVEVLDFTCGGNPGMWGRARHGTVGVNAYAYMRCCVGVQRMGFSMHIPTNEGMLDKCLLYNTERQTLFYLKKKKSLGNF